MVLVEETHASGVGAVAIAPGGAIPRGSQAWPAAQTRLTAADTSVDLVELGPHDFSSSGDCRRSGPAVLFVAVESGRLVGDADGKRFEVLPGQALLIDTRRPMRSRVSEELKLLRVVVDQRRLPRVLSRQEPTDAVVLTDSPVMRACLAATSTLLRRSGDAAIADDDDAIARLLTGVQLGLLDEASRQTRAQSASDARAARREEIEAYIAAHLSDPALSATTISGAVGASVRSVHDAFGGAYDTLGGSIRRQRIDRVLRELRAAGTLPVPTELAAAHGYRDAGQLLRAFRAVPGVSLRTWWREQRSPSDPEEG